ncbi:MAG TPA: response regulator transcription factor [Polyangia bacterium]|jgi:DNA-binding NarL/FixJ family response regulator
MAPSIVRLALVDDHELFRYSLGSVLDRRGFEVVGGAADARSSFEVIDRTRPDVVLLDVAMPGLDGVTATREIISRPARPKVMMLSAYDAPHLVAAAFQAGAHGYAVKSLAIDELVGGIRTVAAGGRYLAPGLTALASSDNGPLSPLSARERDIFRLLVGGSTSTEIAAELCISIKTVETHRQRIFRKLNVHSALQLVRFAVLNDLLIDRAIADDLHRR